MENIKEKINITPDKSLFPKLGQTGYSVAEALAELLDNSIDARDVKVNINVDLNFKDEKITIEDDGIGMNKEQAKESIVLGKSNKKSGQLGQFGIGLKTACMSLGKRFVVETTSKNNDELYTIIFDEDEFLKSGSWSDFEINIKKGIDKERHGTKITIDKFKIRPYAALINTVKNHLTERFSPFIKNNEVKILLNNHVLKPEGEKIVSGTKNNFSITLSSGKEIVGWSGILEVGSVERSGFNLYRYNRLIRAHEKIGYIYHPSKMWITGEIQMDPLPVTHNKREFITEDPLYTEFFDKFQEILKPILAEAQRRHQEEKVKDLPKELRETLKDNILKAMNRVDDLQELAFPETSNRSKNEDGILENKETREEKNDIATIENEESRVNKIRNPNKRSENKVRFITIAGKRYKFDYDWKPLEPEVAKEAYLDKETGTIMVILNSNYHMLNVIKPDWFYHAVYLTEGIVQVFLKENNQPMERMISLRDKITKKLADVISEDIEERATTRDSNMLNAQSYLLKNQSGADDKKLTDNEKLAIKLRLEEGFKYKDISAKLLLTRQRAEQLVKSALAKINGVDIESLRNYKGSSKNLFANKGGAADTKKEKQLIGFNISGKKEKEKVASIINSVSENYGISIDDLMGKKRNSELVLPRHFVMYLLREKLGLSFPYIGKITKKDHTTAMHAYRKIKKLIEKDKLT